MFGITIYSRLGSCLHRQYVSSGTAMRTLSVAEGLDGYQPCWARAGRPGVHTSTACEAKNLMKKFLNKSKKKLWYEAPPPPSSSQANFMKPPKKRGLDDTSRTQVLNSILFKAVTDLLISPELNSEVINYSVEISRVSMSPDFSCCRVYWKSSGVSEQDVIQAALDKSSPRIRYLIMSHQTVGGVPPLVFIKDKQYAAMVEVERLLQTADFGPEDPDSQDGGHQLQTAAAPSAKPVLFGVDHEALGRQIQEYKLRAKEAGPGAGAGSEVALTQTQLKVLEEYRKQRTIEKKKKKSKRRVDDDITPKEFLLAQQGRGQEAGPEEAGPDEAREHDEEDTQLMELMAEENRKS